MVAIYFPQPEPAKPIKTYAVSFECLDNNTDFLVRALHARNLSKDNHITCLGTAVTYNRRCLRPSHHWPTVVNEIVEAADDRTLRLADLKDKAAVWGARLSCDLHFTQAEPAMAVLGAIALYREKFSADEQKGSVRSKGTFGGFYSNARVVLTRAVVPGVEDEKSGKVAVSLDQKLRGAEETCANGVDAWAAEHAKKFKLAKKLQDTTAASQETTKRTVVQEDAVKSILRKVELLAVELGLKTGNEELVSELGG